MTRVRGLASVLGWSGVAIGGLQALGGARVEAGMGDKVDATVDSHVRFMGAIFVGYGIAALDAGRRGDVRELRALAWLMGAGGASRLLTRAFRGRPHRFHDVLMATELAAPVIVEVVTRVGKAVERPRRLP